MRYVTLESMIHGGLFSRRLSEALRPFTTLDAIALFAMSCFQVMDQWAVAHHPKEALQSSLADLTCFVADKANDRMIFGLCSFITLETQQFYHVLDTLTDIIGDDGEPTEPRARRWIREAFEDMSRKKTQCQNNTIGVNFNDGQRIN